MNKSTLLFSLLLATSLTVFGQWTCKEELPGSGRNHPVVFSLNGLGYVYTGFNTDANQLFRDGYRYDPSTDSWTSMPNHPGGPRGFAVGLAHKGKAYLGFGIDNNNFLNDMWEFDPGNNNWTQLASCPCEARKHPAFVATSNDKIYVGLGDGFDGPNFTSGFDDWWEYDIASNTWTQRADLPGTGRHHPYYFAIDTVAYVGMGHFNTTVFDDWYKYDAVTNQWTRLQDFPGQGRVAGAHFTHDGYGYVVDGEGEIPFHTNLPRGEFWKYDHVNDTWDSLASHDGDGLWAPSAFVIDDMAYVMGGDDDADSSYKTLWAYNLAPGAIDSAISTDELSGIATVSGTFFDAMASYQWVDCDNGFAPLDGDTNSVISIPNGRNYALVVTYSKGGMDTSDCYTYTEQVNTSIGSDPFLSEYALSIYPNPTSNQLQLRREKGFEEDLSYNLIDMTGKVVKQGMMQGVQTALDLSELNNGTYFIHLRANNGAFGGVYRVQKAE